MTIWPESSIPEEDDDEYPCLSEEDCGPVCSGWCYHTIPLEEAYF